MINGIDRETTVANVMDESVVFLILSRKYWDSWDSK